MHVVGGVLRLSSAVFFALSVEQAIRPRAVEMVFLLAVAVLLLVTAESISSRASVK
jgi:hypothetical protein